METLLLEIQILNKNTIGVIIGYLTDLPKLPFINQLLFNTRWIKKDDGAYYYNNYYINRGNIYHIYSR